MTTLIFATYDDASPLIHLEAADVEVITRLIRLRAFALAAEPLTPGRWAVEFLGSLSPDERDEWNPRIESTPIFRIDDCLGIAEADIAWDPATWQEWDLDALDKASEGSDPWTGPTTVAPREPTDNAHFFKAVVEICRPELVEATTKALEKAPEAEEQHLANPPGFV